MKNISSVLGILLLLAVGSFFFFQEKNSKRKILISKIADHPALDKTVQGIVDALAASGFTSGNEVEIRIESAQANSALAHQIAINFVHQNPEVVVGIGTVATQAFMKYVKEGKVQLVYSSVTDPVASGIVTALDKKEQNVTGVSNFVPLEPQLALMKTLQPDLKKVGVLYNPGETNSISINKKLEALAPAYGIILSFQAVQKTGDIPQAATKLLQEVDALFISNDSTVLSALSAVIALADAKTIPVYVSDTDAVSLGALAALGPDQYSVGLETGRLIVQLLEQKEEPSQSVYFPTKTELYLNKDVVEKYKIVVPQETQQNAHFVTKS